MFAGVEPENLSSSRVSERSSPAPPKEGGWEREGAEGQVGLTLMAHLVVLRPGPEVQDVRPSGVKAMPSGPKARRLENPCPGPAWTAAQPGVAAEFAVSPAGAAGAEKPPCQRPPPGHRIPAWGAEHGP